MKANELRIGNWVRWNYEESSEGNVYPVEYGYELDDIKNNPNIVKPIPLTEEWLLKFGFEYSDLNGDSGLWKIPPFQIYGKYNQFIYDYRLDVNYVHQLQNLYFALTYEELQTDESDKKVNQ